MPTRYWIQEGNVCAGKILTGDIGISSETFSEGTVTFGYEKQDLFLGFPKRKKNSHKGSYGKVLMIAGSKGMSGAAYLSAKAAYAVGAGLVQIYTHEENRVILQQLLPEAIITTYDTFDSEQLEKLIQWADLIGIGCGLGKSDTAERVMIPSQPESSIRTSTELVITVSFFFFFSSWAIIKDVEELSSIMLSPSSIREATV